VLTGWYPHFSRHKGPCPQEVHAKLDSENPGTFIPDDALGLIACNSTYIEFVDRTFKVKGMVATLMSLCFMVAAMSVGIWTVHALLRSLADDHVPTLLMVVLITTCSCGPCAFLWFIHLRKDLFQYTHYPVRFNRITRKIYLLRPKHLGGIVALDWDTAEVCINPKMSELDGTGGFVMLGWDKETHSVRDADGHLKDDFEITFVGKPTRNASELLAFWEYIRRYMEEGPEAAPKPKKLIGKFPWPWRSFMAVWQLDSRFVKIPQLWIFVPIYCLLLPLILVHACGHWVSLLLCYEPRFPRSIEDAGR